MIFFYCIICCQSLAKSCNWLLGCKYSKCNNTLNPRQVKDSGPKGIILTNSSLYLLLLINICWAICPQVPIILHVKYDFIKTAIVWVVELQGKALECSAKGKFACTIKDLHFVFVRLHYGLSNNGIITLWFSLRAPSLIKKDKTGCALRSKWYPTVIFSPLALYPVAQLSNIQTRENQRKVGKTFPQGGRWMGNTISFVC